LCLFNNWLLKAKAQEQIAGIINAYSSWPTDNEQWKILADDLMRDLGGIDLGDGAINKDFKVKERNNIWNYPRKRFAHHNINGKQDRKCGTNHGRNKNQWSCKSAIS
jgi:hypothetical protein